MKHYFGFGQLQLFQYQYVFANFHTRHIRNVNYDLQFELSLHCVCSHEYHKTMETMLTCTPCLIIYSFFVFQSPCRRQRLTHLNLQTPLTHCLSVQRDNVSLGQTCLGHILIPLCLSLSKIKNKKIKLTKKQL